MRSDREIWRSGNDSACRRGRGRDKWSGSGSLEIAEGGGLNVGICDGPCAAGETLRLIRDGLDDGHDGGEHFSGDLTVGIGGNVAGDDDQKLCAAFDCVFGGLQLKQVRKDLSVGYDNQGTNAEGTGSDREGLGMSDVKFGCRDAVGADGPLGDF